MKPEPAFPADIYYDEQRIDQYSGLTKREYFAAQAMQGIVSAWPSTTDNPKNYVKHVAKTAVAISDALIEALENNP